MQSSGIVPRTSCSMTCRLDTAVLSLGLVIVEPADCVSWRSVIVLHAPGKCTHLRACCVYLPTCVSVYLHLTKHLGICIIRMSAVVEDAGRSGLPSLGWATVLFYSLGGQHFWCCCPKRGNKHRVRSCSKLSGHATAWAFTFKCKCVQILRIVNNSTDAVRRNHVWTWHQYRK